MKSEQPARVEENSEIFDRLHRSPEEFIDVDIEIGSSPDLSGLTSAQAELVTRIARDFELLPVIEFELKYDLPPPTDAERYVGSHGAGGTRPWSDNEVQAATDFRIEPGVEIVDPLDGGLDLGADISN